MKKKIYLLTLGLSMLASPLFAIRFTVQNKSSQPINTFAKKWNCFINTRKQGERNVCAWTTINPGQSAVLDSKNKSKVVVHQNKNPKLRFEGTRRATNGTTFIFPLPRDFKPAVPGIRLPAMATAVRRPAPKPAAVKPAASFNKELQNLENEYKSLAANKKATSHTALQLLDKLDKLEKQYKTQASKSKKFQQLQKNVDTLFGRLQEQEMKAFKPKIVRKSVTRKPAPASKPAANFNKELQNLENEYKNLAANKKATSQDSQQLAGKLLNFEDKYANQASKSQRFQKLRQNIEDLDRQIEQQEMKAFKPKIDF